MTLQFVPVEQDEITYLSKFATQIWMDYWPDIIGLDQTTYMVETFLSPSALTKDIEQNGYSFWMIYDKQELIGFTGGVVDNVTNRYFISKIYFIPAARGKGYMHEVVSHYDALCKKENLDAMYLHVNKNNELGMRAYKGTGFENKGSYVSEIGAGFVVDDWEFERVCCAE